MDGDVGFVPEAFALKAEELTETAALMFGRRSYEAFASTWPGSADHADYRDLPKYVVSSTLENGDEWSNSTILGAYDPAAIRTLKEQTDGHGADVILDNMGAKGLAANVAALAMDGRLVVIGMQGGAKGELNLGALLAKRASITAMGLRGRPLDGPNGKAEVVAGTAREVWPLIADGKVRPVVHATVPLAEAGKAHAMLDAGGVVGKLVLVR